MYVYFAALFVSEKHVYVIIYMKEEYMHRIRNYRKHT